MDSAERMKLDIKRGQKNEDAEVARAVVVEDAAVALWECFVMPILKTVRMEYQPRLGKLDKVELQYCQKQDASRII
jgi:hypothetical protein